MDGANLAWALGITGVVTFALGISASANDIEELGALLSIGGIIAFITAVWIGAANGAFT